MQKKEQTIPNKRSKTSQTPTWFWTVTVGLLFCQSLVLNVIKNAAVLKASLKEYIQHASFWWFLTEVRWNLWQHSKFIFCKEKKKSSFYLFNNVLTNNVLRGLPPNESIFCTSLFSVIIPSIINAGWHNHQVEEKKKRKIEEQFKWRPKCKTLFFLTGWTSQKTKQK